MHQIYGWVDIALTLKTFLTTCTWDVCQAVKKMGMRAPKLLSTPINIALPTAITSMFPICAKVGKTTPASGKLTAEASVPSSLILGSSVKLTNGVPVSTASATLSADANVFPAGTEVRSTSRFYLFFE
jgi:hypothetical protein